MNLSSNSQKSLDPKGVVKYKDKVGQVSTKTVIIEDFEPKKHPMSEPYTERLFLFLQL